MGPKQRNTKELLDEFYKILFSMELTTSEKAELESYNLMDVAQTLYVQRRANRTLKGGSVTQEIF